MYTVNFFNNEDISISAHEQIWTNEDCMSLYKDHNIIYQKGIMAVWIEKRKNMNPLIHLMKEDDGHLFWSRKADICFDSGWINDYISVLQEVELKIDTKKKWNWK